MGERKNDGLSKADIEATNQMGLARRRYKDIAPFIGPHMRLAEESFFDLGKETEPYTEASINALIAQEWGVAPKRRRKSIKP